MHASIHAVAGGACKLGAGEARGLQHVSPHRSPPERAAIQVPCPPVCAVAQQSVAAVLGAYIMVAPVKKCMPAQGERVGRWLCEVVALQRGLLMASAACCWQKGGRRAGTCR